MNLVPLTTLAISNNCYWTGAVSANWDDEGNWLWCGISGLPDDEDIVFLPEDAQNKTLNNNINGLELYSIYIEGSGYTLNGNALTLTATDPIKADDSAVINLDITIATMGGDNPIINAKNDVTLTINGDVILDLTAPQIITTGVSANYAGTVEINGDVSGTAGDQFYARYGTLTLGGNNSFTTLEVGAILGATFVCNSATCFGNDNNKILAYGSTISIATSATFNHDIITTEPTEHDSRIVTDQNVTFTGGITVSDDLIVQQTEPNKNLQFTGTSVLDGSLTMRGADTSSNIKLDAGLSGDGDITVESGNAWFSAPSTFTGDVTVYDGAVAMIDQSASLGSASGKTIIRDGATLYINAASAFVINEPLEVEGDGVGADGFDGAIYVGETSNGDTTLAGDITLTGNTKILHDAPTRLLEITGEIQGTGSLNLWSHYSDDPSILAISGNNSFSGDTNVMRGLVYFTHEGSIPGNLNITQLEEVPSQALFYNSSDNMSDAGIITFNGAQTTLFLTENDEVIGGLQGDDGTVQIESSGDRLIIDQDFDSTFAGKFRGNGGVFEKRGDGTLTLTGTYLSAEDEIQFNAVSGVLSIDGDFRAPSGDSAIVNVNGGILKGTGTVGAVTAQEGTIAPGNSPGKIEVSSLTLQPGTSFEVEIDGNEAGVSYDQVVSSGAVDLGGAVLDIVPSYTPTVGEVFTIITGTSITGTFAGLADGSIVNIDGLTFRVNYTASSVTLTFVEGELASTGQGAGLVYLLITGFLVTAGSFLVTRRMIYKHAN